MLRSDFRHFTELSVRWGDADALGHINNVQYARYLESARVAYSHDVVDINFGKHQSQSMILADIQLSFLKQLHYPCLLEIGTRVSKMGNKSLEITAAIFRKGEPSPVLTSVGVMVWFDYAQNQTDKIPDDIRAKLVDFEPETIL